MCTFCNLKKRAGNSKVCFEFDSKPQFQSFQTEKFRIAIYSQHSQKLIQRMIGPQRRKTVPIRRCHSDILGHSVDSCLSSHGFPVHTGWCQRQKPNQVAFHSTNRPNIDIFCKLSHHADYKTGLISKLASMDLDSSADDKTISRIFGRTIYS